MTVHRRHHRTDAAFAALQVLLYPHGGVIRYRLHRPVERSSLASCDGVQHAQGLPAWKTSGHLRRAVDRGCRRGVRGAVIELRGAPDAPRVKQALAGVAVVDGAAIHVEPKDPGPLDEKGTPLLKERFERGQVEHRRIRLDLSKVGVDRRVERKAWRNPVAYIGTRSQLLRAIEGSAGQRLGYVLRQEVGREFGPPRRG